MLESENEGWQTNGLQNDEWEMSQSVEIVPPWHLLEARKSPNRQRPFQTGGSLLPLCLVWTLPMAWQPFITIDCPAFLVHSFLRPFNDPRNCLHVNLDRNVYFCNWDILQCLRAFSHNKRPRERSVLTIVCGSKTHKWGESQNKPSSKVHRGNATAVDAMTVKHINNS